MTDVLAAVSSLAGDVGRLQTETTARFDRVDTKFEQVFHRLDRTDVKIERVRADLAQARADIAAVKVETSYTESHIGDLQEAFRRHLQDPKAHPGREAA